MAASRCPSCDIKYPSDLKRCQVCGDDLDYRVTFAVDTDWRRRVSDAITARIAPDTEAARVERWRLETLLTAGYEVDDAELLAQRKDVELHQAVALIQRGCPATTAAQILL